jgi:hypothetical protein
MVINSNFYKSSWDETLIITLLLVTICALTKLINRYPSHPIKYEQAVHTYIN